MAVTPKKPAEKAAGRPRKAASPKAAAKAAAPEINIFVEYEGKQVSQEEIVSAVSAAWSERGDGAPIATMDLYVKPEDGAVYYVVNGDGCGKVKY